MHEILSAHLFKRVSISERGCRKNNVPCCAHGQHPYAIRKTLQSMHAALEWVTAVCVFASASNSSASENQHADLSVSLRELWGKVRARGARRRTCDGAAEMSQMRKRQGAARTDAFRREDVAQELSAWQSARLPANAATNTVAPSVVTGCLETRLASGRCAIRRAHPPRERATFISGIFWSRS
jgi:hypothetical protein